MDCVRRAALIVSFLVLAMGVALGGGAPARPLGLQPAAVVSWPTSALILSELQTGGTSASDEFFELANAGAGSVDLAGLEVVYVTSTGSTVTRKASWPSGQLLEPGRHLLVANGAGVYVDLSDATYSGGLAATGGVLVLRVIGGSPIDAVGWGDADNAFVEGNAAPAPPPGSSLERRPGGILGNATDSNDNLADFVVRETPTPQPLSAPPVPVPSASATTTPTGLPSTAPSPPGPEASQPPATADPTGAPPSAAPSASAPGPSGSPSPGPSSGPSAPGEPSEAPEPPQPSAAPSVPPQTPGPTTPKPSLPAPSAEPPTPTPAASHQPSPLPSGLPSPEPTTLPSPSVIDIAGARALPKGASAAVRGVLTSPLGLLDDGRLAFVEDETGGLAVYLDEAPLSVLPAGTTIVVSGTMDERYGAVTLRATSATVSDLGPAAIPDARVISTGLVGEALEGRRASVTGATVGSGELFVDGTGLLIDDGSGAIRVIVSDAALEGRVIAPATVVTAVGPVGQRDSSGTGTTGYRIYATLPGDLLVGPGDPSGPSPTPGVEPSASPSGSPGTSPSPSAGPVGSPTPPAPTSAPSPAPGSIVDARRLAVGTTVSVAGVVTAEAGRLGTPPLLSIEDGTAGLVVRLPDGMTAPPRGSRVAVTGLLADPFGQLELRPQAGGIRVVGTAALPSPMSVTAADVGEATEGRLVEVEGSVAATPSRSTSNDIAFDLVDTHGRRLRILADASSGLLTTSVRAGHTYRLTGIAGQRASRKGALDGYRLWLRDGLDIVPLGGPTGGSGNSTGTGATPISIRAAIGQIDKAVTIVGTVTVPSRLLDATNRRIVVQDATAAIEAFLPVDAVAPEPGRRVRLLGVVGRAYGAPRLRATAVEVLAGRESLEPQPLVGSPGEPLEWQLVRVAGTVVHVTRLGSRWRAELDVAGRRLLIDGLPGAAIAATVLVEGRPATVTGIVKRPYPGATDTRYSIVPRSPADVTPGSDAGGAGNGGGRRLGQAQVDLLEGSALPGLPAPVDIDLGAIAEHTGQVVRVGGLVVAATPTGVTLDDGTAVGIVVLEGEARAYRGLLEPGDAINAIGQVVRRDAVPGRWALLVTDPRALVRVGELGEPRSIAAPRSPLAGDPDPSPGSGGPAVTRLGLDQLLVEPGAAAAGLATLALMSVLSVASAVVRRRRARALAVRVASRLRRYVDSPD